MFTRVYKIVKGKLSRVYIHATKITTVIIFVFILIYSNLGYN